MSAGGECGEVAGSTTQRDFIFPSMFALVDGLSAPGRQNPIPDAVLARW